MRKFWNWQKVTNATAPDKDPKDERILRIDGVIAEESWFDDDVTPEEFRKELNEDTGDIVLWINSPGGDVFAAAQIYNMLKEYPGKVTVKIDGLAASAASVIAVAGDEVLMSPVSTLMIHNPTSFAAGDSEEMKKAQQMLEEAAETLINAYELKTGLPRRELARLMKAETWMNANAALEKHFIDGILYVETAREPAPAATLEFSPAQIAVAIAEKISAKCKAKAPAPAVPTGRSFDELMERLNLMKVHF